MDDDTNDVVMHQLVFQPPACTNRYIGSIKFRNY